MAARSLLSTIVCAGAALALVACGGDDGGSNAGDTADRCSAAPGEAALCLTFRPEQITPEPEPALDQWGFFRVQVFDTPTPLRADTASSGALHETTFPSDFEQGGEISLADLPAPSVVLVDPPSAVYVRAVFFDNASLVDGRVAIDWGCWLGGFDLAGGVAGTSTLLPVELAAGQVTMLDVPLIPLRRLTANVTTSATPLGDGEGALSVVASRVEALPPAAPTYGYGIDPCVDVSRGAQTVEMFLIGSGTFFVAASFEDLGIQTAGGMPPGTMLSVRDFDPATGQGTFDRITVANDAYAARVLLDLGYVSPFAGDPSVLGPNSCADLGLPGPP
jgi:hypothetical protein